MKGSSGSNSTGAKDREAEIQRILEILHKWGIHTLGQLVALDKEQLGARLSPEAVRMWERANGQSDRPLKLIRPPESFEESFEFENEIETTEPLLFILRRFLEQLAVRLSGIYFVAKELTLRITFTNKQQYERCFKIPQPTNDVDLLFRMLQTHLENFKSIAVSLQGQPIKPNSQQFGLFETALRNPNQLSETLARLTALLGVDRVGTPVLDETHRPDAFHIEPFSWEPGAIEHHPAEPIKATSRVALRRFRPAVAASVFLSENIPVHLRNANVNGKVAEQRGPYLASGNWWDETAWTCAEWDLQLENAVLLRCRQSPPSLRSGVAGVEKWEVDGVYD